jgi:peptidoglycan/LPS O-acetylase OafA/YrhL
MSRNIHPHAEYLEFDRITELDGVRGFALAMVLWLHCFLVNPTSVVARLANSIGGSMFISLDLFFVLSGFLITGILIRTRESPHRARNFYVRRVLRIFPAYYLVLIFIFLIYPMFYAPLRQTHAEKESIYFFFYVQNLRYTWTGGRPAWPGLEHLWSMAVEEQFYLLWPIIVWCTPPNMVARLCAGVIAASVAIKLALLAVGATVNQVYLPTYCRLEGLAAGAGLAALWLTHGVRRTPRWLNVVGLTTTICLLWLIFRKSGTKVNPKDLVAHTITATGAFSWMIFAAVTSSPDAAIRRFFRNKVLCFLGRYSYGIYLLHYVVYWQVKYFVLDALGSKPNGDNPSAIIAGIAIIAITIALALVMYHIYEAPVLRLKRFFTSSSAPLAARHSQSRTNLAAETSTSQVPP